MRKIKHPSEPTKLIEKTLNDSEQLVSDNSKAAVIEADNEPSNKKILSSKSELESMEIDSKPDS